MVNDWEKWPCGEYWGAVSGYNQSWETIQHNCLYGGNKSGAKALL